MYRRDKGSLIKNSFIKAVRETIDDADESGKIEK